MRQVWPDGKLGGEEGLDLAPWHAMLQALGLIPFVPVETSKILN